MSSSQGLIGFEPHQFDHMLWCKQQEGKPLLYYMGDLAGDCAPWDWNMDEAKYKRAITMRKAAWHAYSEQRCHLVQRQRDFGIYEYWAYPSPKRTVIPPLGNDGLRERYLARMSRGGRLTAAVILV